MVSELYKDSRLELDKAILFKMSNLSTEYINWFEEGGAEIIKVNYKWYVWFDIPQYGGNPIYEGTFREDRIDEMLNKIYGRT